MKYLLLLTALMFGTVQAFEANTNSNSNSNSAAGAVSSSGSSSNQGQTQGQSSYTSTGQGQGQSLTYAPTTIYKAGGTERNEVDYSGSYTVRSAPTMMAPAVYSSNPCIIPISVGLSVIGGGLSGGTGVTDVNCVAQNNAMRFVQMNDPVLAKEIMCGLEDVYVASKRTKAPCTLNKEFEEDEASNPKWNGLVGAK